MIKEQETLTPEDIVDILIDTNDPKYNLLKLCEELTELQEKILKYINKKPDKQPSKEEIIEEVGDVTLRLLVAVEILGITDEEIEERIEQKSQKLLNYYKEGKYKGGI